MCGVWFSTVGKLIEFFGSAKVFNSMNCKILVAVVVVAVAVDVVVVVVCSHIV